MHGKITRVFMFGFRLFLSVLVVVQSWGVSLPGILMNNTLEAEQKADAFVELSSSEGYQTVDFLGNQAGITSGVNTVYNTTAGTVKGSAVGGSVTLSEVTPVSFKQWNTLDVTYVGNPNNITVELYACAAQGGGLIQTIPNLPVNGKIALGGIDKNVYPCLQPKIVFEDTLVSVDDVTVKWEPLPLYSIAIDAPETKPSCGTTSFTIAYSLSYASDTDVVLYSRLPNSTYGSVTEFTPSYNQFPAFNPDFISANKGGQYTANAIMVRGVSIPSNAVYWEWDEMVEGETDTLTYVVEVPCGTENGVVYEASAFIDGVRADSAISPPPPAATAIITTSNPQILKEDSGTLRFDEEPINKDGLKHFVYPQYRTLVNYTIRARNANANQLGSEVLFEPTVVDDMSDVATKIANSCTGGTLQDRFSLLSSQSMAWSGNSAVFSDLGNFWTGHNPTTNIKAQFDTKIEYSIDFAGCAIEGTTFYNQASLYGDNGGPVTDHTQVEVLLYPRGDGIWSKGHFGDFFYAEGYGSNAFDTLQKSLEHCSGDDNPRKCGTVGLPHNAYYGDEFYYTFNFINRGPVRLENSMISDLLPDGVEFIDAGFGLPPGMGQAFNATSITTVSGGTTNVDGQIFYSNQLTLPAFGTGLTDTYAGNPGTGWSSSDFGSATKGVLFAPKCLNSQFFPVPAGQDCHGDAASWFGWIKVKIPDSTSCDEITIENTARLQSFQVGADTDNLDGNFTAWDLDSEDTSHVTVRPPEGAFQIYADVPGTDDGCDQYSSDCNPRDIFAPDVATYRYTISNQGAESLLSGLITVEIPQLEISGMTGYLNLTNVSVTNASVNYSQVGNGKIVINAGQLAPGQSIDLSISFQVPKGIVEGDIYEVKITTTGLDNYCGQIANTKIFQTVVHGLPQLELYKYVDKAYIGSQGQITYSLDARNKGEGDATNTFVVDRIPLKTQFVSAITSGGISECASQNSFSCPGCKVYMADISNVGPGKPLPVAPNPALPFTDDQIYSNFQLGIDNGDGTWSAPAGMNVAYVAYLLDNQALGYFPAQSENVCLGMRVTDIDNGVGQLIVNNAAIISDQNLQAISNQVRTTLLGIPGLEIDIYSDPHSYVAACEEFDWIVDWSHNASDHNTQTWIDIELPSTVIYSGNAGDLLYQWNNYAIASGANSNQYDISSDSNVQVLTENGKTIIRTHINDENVGGLLNTAPASVGDYLQPLRGGTFKVHVQAKCGLPQDAVLTATTKGTYENLLHEGEVTAEDPVIIKAPDLWLVKNVDMSDPLLGGTINYVVDVSNQGEYRADSVVFTDHLPEHICYVPGSFAGVSPGYVWDAVQVQGDCLAGGQTITAQLMNTPSGQASLPAHSPVIKLSYAATIHTDYPLGTSSINIADVQTSTDGDPLTTMTGEVCNSSGCTNVATETVTPPLPDPYSIVTSPQSINACEEFSYEISYGNASRNCAENVYTIFTMPNYSAGGTAATPVLAVYPEHGEEIYYRACPYEAIATNPPSFDPLAPTTNGWTATAPAPTDSICYIAIKRTQNAGTMCLSDGQNSVTVLTKAASPGGSCAQPGDSYTGSTVAIGTNGNNNPNNDTDDTRPVVPNVNMVVDIQGGQEGSFPCILPDKGLDYTVAFRNDSTQPSCGIDIDVTLSQWVDYLSDTSSTIALADGKQFTNPLGVPLTNITVTKIGPTTDVYGNKVYTYRLGGATTTERDQVCMPAHSNGQFMISTKTTSPIPDQTNINSTSSIAKFTGQPEEILGDNTDTTQVLACRTDLMTRKNGIADRDGDGNFSGANDSMTLANQSDVIEYIVEYDNIGNAPAENAVITEDIPEGTCLNVSSLKANVPAGATLVMYDANGGVVDYPGALQCTVRKFTITFDVLPNPASFDTESCTREAVLPDFAQYRDYAGLENSMCEEQYDDVIGDCVENWSLDDDLVAYWSFDANDATDDAGNGFNGTLDTNVSFALGVSGQAAFFDGSASGRIDIPALRLSDGTHSIAFFAKYEGSTNQNNKGMPFGGGLHPNGTDERGYLRYQSNSDTWYLRNTSESLGFNHVDNTIEDAQRHHIAFTRNGNYYDFYIDGVKVGQYTDLTVEDFVIRMIGNTYNLSAYGWEGGIDELRVYDRVLFPGEINYLAGLTSTLPEICKARDDGLVAYYTFDDGTSRDMSGLGNDGQDIGGVSYTGGVNASDGVFSPTVTGYIVSPVSILSTEDFSYSTWVYISQLPYTSWKSAITTNVGDPTNNYSLYSSRFNAPSFYHESFQLLGQQRDRAGWHHIGLSRAGTTYTLFQDGAAVSSGNFASVIDIPQVHIADGVDWTGIPSGKMDNVRIYDRALSSEEINDIYHSERGDVCEQRSDGLVAHYTFDNPADLGNDDSGGGNDGTTQGGVLATGGKIGGAASFDGVDNYVEKGTMTLSSSFAIGGWIYPLGTGGIVSCHNTFIIGQGHPGGCTPQSWGMGYSHHDYAASLDKKIVITWGDGSGFPTIASNQQVEQQVRSHVMWVKENDQGYLYINGVLDQTFDMSNMVLSNNHPLKIGNRYSGQSSFPGKLDDLRIYDRALSASEIERMYKGADGGLVGYYPFDDGTANDRSGEGNDLTLFNGAAIENGLIGNQLSLDGNNDAAHTESRLSSHPIVTNNFTLGSWFKTTDINGGVIMNIQGSPSRAIMNITPTGTIKALTWDNNGVLLACETPANIIYNTNTRHHATILRDGDNDIFSILIDGKQQASCSDTRSAGFNWNNILYLGAPDDLFNGSIDEVRIYNRLLDQDEISYLAQMSECSFVGGHEGTDEREPNVFGTNTATGSDAIRLDTKKQEQGLGFIRDANAYTGHFGTDNAIPNDIRFADVDNDGDDDIVIQYQDGGYPRDVNNLMVVVKNNEGVYDPSAADIYDLGGFRPFNVGMSDLLVGDINNDGYPDAIAVAYDSVGSGTAVWMNQGDGSFVFTSIIGLPWGIYGSAILDTNTDGNLDFIGFGYSGYPFVYYGSGDGTFVAGPAASSWADFAPGSFIYNLTYTESVDLDGDGDKDVLGSNNGDPLAHVLLLYNNGDGTFEEQNISNKADATYIGVVNGDITIVLVDATTRNIELRKRNSGGQYIYDSTIGQVTSLQNSINAGDTNNDGINEIFVEFEGKGIVYKEGVWDDFTFTIGENYWYYRKHKAQLADINSDGFKDFIGSRNGAYGDVVFGGIVYQSTGTYTTTITADTPVQYRDKLYVNQTVPNGTEIAYEILDATCTTTVIGPMTTSLGVINLSSLDAAQQEYCLKVHLSSENPALTPSLDQRVASYKSTITPSFSFQVQLEEGRSLSEIDDIVNRVRISTDTPETTQTNNQDNHTHTIIKGDLVITKTVDKGVAVDGESVVYTLSYVNNGPQTMEGVVIEDTLPPQLNYVSASPTMTQIVGKTYAYNVGTLAAGQGGTIIINGTISGAMTNDLLVNVTDIVSTGTAETDYTNNTDTAITLVNMLPNLFTTVNAPSLTQCVGSPMTVTYTFGNNGNNAATAVVASGSLDDRVTFVGFTPELTGLSYLSGSHEIVWNGDLAIGETITAQVVVTPLPIYMSGLDLDDPWMVFASSITPAAGEFDRSDNFAVSDDQATAQRCDLAALQGHIYIDTDKNNAKDPTDPYFLREPITVYLSGTDVFGNPVTGEVQTVGGEYFFGNLLPGTYTTYYYVPSGYDQQSSVGGYINQYDGSGNVINTIPTGSGSVNGHLSPVQITNISLEAGQLSQFNDFGISSVYDLTISKTLSGSTTVQAGDTITWLLTYTLSGAQRDDISIIDTLPTGLVYQSVSQFGSPLTGLVLTGDGFTSAQQVQFNRLTAFPATPVTIEVNTLVSPYVLSGTSLTNMTIVGTVDGTGTVLIDPETNTGNNNDDAQITVLNTVLGTIGGHVYVDGIDNNEYDSLVDTGIAGQTVVLSGMDYLGFPIVMTGVTMSGGAYLFTGLASGNYTVSYINSSIYTPDSSQTGNVLGTESGAPQSPMVIANIPLGEGDEHSENDFGLIALGGLGGVVYYDKENSDLFTGTNEGITGIVVFLSGIDLNGSGYMLQTTTSSGGAYVFTGLYSGSYTVWYETYPPVWTPDSTQTGTTSGQAGVPSVQYIQDIPVGTSMFSQNNNFGLVATVGSIAGTIYYDQEEDELLNNGNPGISGQTVTLSGTDWQGNPVSLTGLTNGSGGYLFSGLVAGNYTVSYTNSSQYVPDSTQPGSTTGTVVISIEQLANIGLQPGEVSTENDFGLIARADLVIDKQADSPVKYNQETVLWTISVLNNGPSEALDVIVEDTLPTGFVLDTIDPILPTPMISGNTYTWNVGMIPAGTGVTLQLSGWITGVSGSVIENSATVSTSTTETNTGNNRDDAQVMIANANISLQGVAYRDRDWDHLFSILSGDTVLSGVTVILSGVEIGGSGYYVTQTDANGQYLFALESTLIGEFTIMIQTPDGFVSWTSHAGEIDGLQRGWGSEDGSSWKTDEIALVMIGVNEHGVEYNFGVVRGDMTITKEVTSRGVYFSGSTVSYRLIWENRSPVPMSGVSVYDFPGTGLLVDLGASVVSGGGLYRYIGDVGPYASGQIAVSGIVQGGGGELVDNSVQVVSSSQELTTGNNSDDASVVVLTRPNAGTPSSLPPVISPLPPVISPLPPVSGPEKDPEKNEETNPQLPVNETPNQPDVPNENTQNNESESTEGPAFITLPFKFLQPKEFLPTGIKDLYDDLLSTKGLKTYVNTKNVNTSAPAWFVPGRDEEAGKALSYWESIVPQTEWKQYYLPAEAILAIPSQGIIMPVNYPKEDGITDPNDEVGHLKYLDYGAVQRAGSAYLGSDAGPILIEGHSASLVTNNAGPFGAAMKALVLTEPNAVIYAFVKTSDGAYQRYMYRVTSKTNVNPDNTSILTKNPNGTLFLSACGDDQYVGSLKARNIVIAELVGEAGVEMDTIIPAVVYDEEIKEAYTWAKEEGVTTQPTIQDARMYDTLTRGELAKMMVEWTRGRSEGSERNGCTAETYGDYAGADAETQQFMLEACAMGLMGRDGQGGTTKAFRWTDGVSRAEFGAVLSRALRGTQYDRGGENWYAGHLEALKAAGIMTKIDNPFMQEIRGYVMVMLMRVQ